MNLEEQASAQAGNAGASSDATAQSGSAEAPVSDWTSGLSEDNRKTVEVKGWVDKGPDDVISAYRSLESHLGKALVPPKEDASPEDWSKFYAKLGRPEKAEAYELPRPSNIPENLPYDAGTADEFKNWAHEAGLTPRQAAAIHNKYMERWASEYAANEARKDEAGSKAHEELVQVWGDPNSEKYKRNTSLATRAIEKLGGDSLLRELKQIGVLDERTNAVLTPRLAVALAAVGNQLYAEDKDLFRGETTGANPFSDKTRNETEQGRIITENPVRAKALIRQAGIDPKDYGFKD